MSFGLNVPPEQRSALFHFKIRFKFYFGGVLARCLFRRRHVTRLAGKEGRLSLHPTRCMRRICIKKKVLLFAPLILDTGDLVIFHCIENKNAFIQLFVWIFFLCFVVNEISWRVGKDWFPTAANGQAERHSFWKHQPPCLACFCRVFTLYSPHTFLLAHFQVQIARQTSRAGR